MRCGLRKQCASRCPRETDVVRALERVDGHLVVAEYCAMSIPGCFLYAGADWAVPSLILLLSLSCAKSQTATAPSSLPPPATKTGSSDSAVSLIADGGQRTAGPDTSEIVRSFNKPVHGSGAVARAVQPSAKPTSPMQERNIDSGDFPASADDPRLRWRIRRVGKANCASSHLVRLLRITEVVGEIRFNGSCADTNESSTISLVRLGKHVLLDGHHGSSPATGDDDEPARPPVNLYGFACGGIRRVLRAECNTPIYEAHCEARATASSKKGDWPDLKVIVVQDEDSGDVDDTVERYSWVAPKCEYSLVRP